MLPILTHVQALELSMLRPSTFSAILCGLLNAAFFVWFPGTSIGQQPPAAGEQGELPVLEVPDAVANTEAEMKPYKEIVEQADVSFELLPIPSGSLMGSPDDEDDRREDEGPQPRD